MKVYGVILNWNRKEDTLECLRSFKKVVLKNIDLELLIVDNASNDGSVNEFKKIKFSNFKVSIIENKKNLGFAEGNNVGIRHALAQHADYIFVLNNDTIVAKEFLTKLIKVAEKNRKAALLSPKIYFAKGYEFHKDRYSSKDLGKVIWYAGGEIDWDNVYGTNKFVDEVYRGWNGKPYETDFATGACVLMRPEALKEVGIFDKKYFMYFEDVDLSQRMLKKGWKVLVVPESHIWHKVAQSSGIGSGLNDYFITRNRLIFGMKFAPKKTKRALLKEAVKFIIKGRKWQRKGAFDFFLRRYGKGSWN